MFAYNYNAKLGLLRIEIGKRKTQRESKLRSWSGNFRTTAITEVVNGEKCEIEYEI